jgi:hypothetical protein
MDILKRNGIPGIDLLPPFRSALRDEEREIFSIDNHWNAEGHSLAASEVLDALLAQGFIPAP